MITNPVHGLPAAQNEAAVKTAPRQNPPPPQASVPQDRVTISPHAQAQQTPAAEHNHGDSRPNDAPAALLAILPIRQTIAITGHTRPPLFCPRCYK